MLQDPLNRFFVLCVIGASVFTFWFIQREPLPVQVGDRAIDPSSVHSSLSTVTPINWDDLPEADRTGFMVRCRRQSGATMVAIDTFEDEVLVSYVNEQRGKDSPFCPSGVQFWVSDLEFQSATAEYHRLKEVAATQGRASAANASRTSRKKEIEERHRFGR